MTCDYGGLVVLFIFLSDENDKERILSTLRRTDLIDFPAQYLLQIKIYIIILASRCDKTRYSYLPSDSPCRLPIRCHCQKPKATIPHRLAIITMTKSEKKGLGADISASSCQPAASIIARPQHLPPKKVKVATRERGPTREISISKYPPCKLSDPASFAPVPPSLWRAKWKGFPSICTRSGAKILR